MGIAATLAQYLLDQDIAYELVPYPGSRPPARNIVESVVIRNDKGFMVVLAPASRHIAFEKLRQLLGSNVDIANEEQVEELFVDCEPGCVPALGSAYGLPLVIDDSLAAAGEVYLQGGDHAHLVRLSAANFLKATQHARRGQFTDAQAAA